MAPGPQYAVELTGASKRYGGAWAVDGVSLAIRAGEVHALVGENGAGKSTLMKIIAGSVMPDHGQVLVGGMPIRLGSVQASEAAGIAIIHQELVAFEHLDAPDNIFVGREPRRLGGLWLDRRTMERRTRDLLDRLGESLDLRTPVGRLPVAQRQMVGIARVLSRRCRVLIMDEPTASLSSRETQVLFRIIRQLKADGVSILYVSHRLEEIFELADSVTVLRDGRHVATLPIDQTDSGDLIRRMVGRELAQESPSDRTTGDAPVLLSVKGLTRRGVFSDISLELRAGEIVALAGLVGAGRSEVARAIFGIDPRDRGTVQVADKTVAPLSVASAMRAGLALVPEDRQHLGLVLPMTVGQNLTMGIWNRLSRLGLLSAGRERLIVAKLMEELTVKAAGSGVPAQTLSGGNQQKLVLGKWLARQPRVLILDEPTRGVDVGAKAGIYKLIRRLAAQGMAVLLISSELPEVLLMADRILVMRQGRISGQLHRDEASQERILSLALPDTARDIAEVGT